ncbi:mCG1049216 [Mus musculus]|nr:mCG1049216 [Mus musculus]
MQVTPGQALCGKANRHQTLDHPKSNLALRLVSDIFLIHWNED